MVINNKTLQDSKIVAKLVNNERKFLRSPAANVSVTAQILGAISHDSLRKALDSIQKIHPLTGARVEFNATKDAFFSRSNIPPIPLRIVPRVSDMTWFESIQEEHLTPFNAEKGPLLRFILNYSPDLSELTVFSQHSICDATALAYLLRDILMIMSDSPIPINPVSVPRLEIASIPQLQKDNSFGTRLKEKIIAKMNIKWLANPYYFDQTDYEAMYQAYQSQYQYNAVILELDSSNTENILQKCRNHGVTMNSALTMAFLMAYQQIGGKFRRKNPRLAIPYDLRSRIPEIPKNSFGLFVSSIELQPTLNRNKSFWENVQQFHRMAKTKIESREVFGAVKNLDLLDPTLMDVMTSFAVHGPLVSSNSPCYEKIHKFISDNKNIAIKIASNFVSALPDMINTNLGRLDFSMNYGNLRLNKMYFTPSASHAVPLLLGIVGVAGITAITLNFLDNRVNPDSNQKHMLELVKNRALQYLMMN